MCNSNVHIQEKVTRMIFPLAVGSNFVDVIINSPGFQRKLMLWPIPVVRGKLLIR